MAANPATEPATPDTTHTEVGAAAHKAPFPPFNPEFFASQIFWLVVTFVIFFLVIRNLAVPRIGGILEDRAGRISGDLAAAQSAKQRSDEAIAAYEQALTEAKAKAHGIAEKARAVSAKAAEARRAETEAELARKLAAAEARIGEIKARALGEVGAIAGETTEAIIQALIGRDVSSQEINEAVAVAMGK